jgi:formate dehydrogenase accessory protein FdhE
VGSPWSVRRARASHLLDRAPHAKEILAFYVELTEAQERVAEQVPTADWLALVRIGRTDRTDQGHSPWLDVGRLPLDELALPFRDFLSRVAEFGTETIKDSAQALLSAEDEGRLETLQVAVAAWRKADDASGDVDQPDDFHARAFLEPVVTSIAQTTQVDTHPPADWTQNFCYACGGLPQIAVIRDLPDALGSRTLSCSMCATEWRFPRLTCPHCGETEADKLPVHTAESIAHVRVDACGACSRYIKTVDLRKEGNAVPCVDELAAIELDIWAREQGLTKLRTNVLGL